MLLYSEDRALDEENREKVVEILLGRNYDYEDDCEMPATRFL